MLKLSQAIKDILSSKSVQFFYLIEIQDFYPLTSASHVIMMDNLVTYGSTTIMSAEPPHASSSVDRSPYRIVFGDPEFSFKAYAEFGLTGVPVTVRLGFYNTLGEVRDGIQPDQPFTQIENTLLAYKGIIDNVSFDADSSTGVATVTLECSNPMADLGLVRAFYTNNDSMLQRNPADTAFHEVFEGSGEIKLKWGKA